jgi:hypothetical protein
MHFLNCQQSATRPLIWFQFLHTGHSDVHRAHREPALNTYERSGRCVYWTGGAAGGHSGVETMVLKERSCSAEHRHSRSRLIHSMEKKLAIHSVIITLRGLSSRANYTDRATSACRRSWCQLLRIQECRVVSAADPRDRILGFLDRSRYFFLQVAPQLYSRGWVDPVPDPLVAPGIEPGPLDLKTRALTTRPQRQSIFIQLIEKCAASCRYQRFANESTFMSQLKYL